MAKVISVFNQKGGVGKTTIATNLAVGIKNRKRRVLFIDLDPQANATSGLGFDKEGKHKNVYDFLINDIDSKEIIKNINGLDLMPSHVDLSVYSFSDRTDYNVLKNKIKTLKNNYDYIIVDCPPSLAILSLNALVASDSVIIPVQCEYYALEGLKDLIDTINRTKSSFNESLYIEGVILNMYDKRNNLTKDVEEVVKNHFEDKVYQTHIPRNVRLAEAPSYGESIYEYDTLSKGAFAFRKWVKEFIKRSESEEKRT